MNYNTKPVAENLIFSSSISMQIFEFRMTQIIIFPFFNRFEVQTANSNIESLISYQTVEQNQDLIPFNFQLHRWANIQHSSFFKLNFPIFLMARAALVYKIWKSHYIASARKDLHPLPILFSLSPHPRHNYRTLHFIDPQISSSRTHSCLADSLSPSHSTEKLSFQLYIFFYSH